MSFKASLIVASSAERTVKLSSGPQEPCGGSRVEEWHGGLGAAYRSGPFVCRGFTSRTLPRFHSPLIEPDVQLSRIRLSDQVPHVRSREAELPSLELHQPQTLVQMHFREA